MTVGAAGLLVLELARFGFSEFTPEFLATLTLEVPHLHAQANMPFDWSAIDGAKEYDDEQARKRALHAAEPPNPAMPTRRPPSRVGWKHDPTERARRYWLWWKIRVHTIPDIRFHSFAIAVRLCALVQPSSCGIERVFSQLKMIDEACGEMLEETLESRLYERCNKNDLPLM